MKLTCAITACVLFAALSLTRPALPVEPQLEITSPKANATVSGEVIELTGTGADPSGMLEVEVLTNQWWPQDGAGRINPDGSWTYSPVYLSGKGSFNNHAIRVTQIKDHRRGKSTIVAGIVRKQ
jgi:hypothetical protein